MLRGLCYVAVVAIAILLLSGWIVFCEHNRTGTLTGKVTFNGKPLPGGLITLTTTADGEVRTYPGRIQKDGTYKVPNVPAGLAQVSVATVNAAQFRGDSRMPADPGWLWR
jgi:hypothetical protein